MATATCYVKLRNK